MQGKDMTYTDVEYQDVYRQFKQDQSKGTEKQNEKSGFFASTMDSWLAEVREMAEVFLTGPEESVSIDDNLAHAILLTFEDAYKRFGVGGINNKGQPVPMCPVLVRVLVTGILDEKSKIYIKKNIVEIIRKTLDETGIPSVDIFISDDNRYIPAAPPAIHIGIDYEPADLIPMDKSMKAIGTIRTSRG